MDRPTDRPTHFMIRGANGKELGELIEGELMQAPQKISKIMLDRLLGLG